MKMFINTPRFAVISSVAEFRQAMGSVLGILMTIAFLVGVVLIIGGALKRDDNPAGAKNAMITGSIIAGAVAIMGILYTVFGISGGAVDAAF